MIRRAGRWGPAPLTGLDALLLHAEEAVVLPEIQIAWEDWSLDLNVREDKYFVPQVRRLV